MLRSGNKIRFNNDREKRIFKLATGRVNMPETAKEHDRIIDDAVENYIDQETPEGRLLAMMMTEAKLGT